jgi:hypothetical protein
MNCSSRCPTPGAHQTFGECLRALNLKVGYCRSAAGLDLTRQKAWDKELSDYRSARSQGIQPEGTSTRKIREAVEISNKAGKAYDAASRSFKD